MKNGTIHPVHKKILEQLVEKYGADEVADNIVNYAQSNENSGIRKVIIDLINIIEACTRSLKGIHWNAETMAVHNLSDEVIEYLIEVEDTLAETMMGAESTRIMSSDLTAVNINVENLEQALEYVMVGVDDAYDAISAIQGNRYNGLMSVLDDISQNIDKFRYLAKIPQ